MEKLQPLLEATTAGRRLIFDIEDVRLPAKQASSLAVIASELVSNAVKHGCGEISVRLERNGTECTLEVLDQGPGFGHDFDPHASAGTGLDLVKNLTSWDMGGSLTCKNGQSGGGLVAVMFTLQEDSTPPAVAVAAFEPFAPASEQPVPQ
jgi:two-component sensor histidine kinase